MHMPLALLLINSRRAVGITSEKLRRGFGKLTVPVFIDSTARRDTRRARPPGATVMNPGAPDAWKTPKKCSARRGSPTTAARLTNLYLNLDHFIRSYTHN